MGEVRILTPRDGDVLNHHDGRQDESGLTIRVAGTAPPQSRIEVNGTPANADSGRFAVELTLTGFRTTIAAVGADSRDEAVVYWDRHAGRRYRFSTDDNIYFLKDLATAGHRSLFDNFYLAFWREMHQRYGTRVQHNIYWCEPEGFDLSAMPDRYRGEWEDSADWLRLTFHAEQNDPARPYIAAGYDLLARDFDRVTNEIVRFAGAGSLCPFTTVHWGEATFDGCQALRDRGILGLAGYFNTGLDEVGRVVPRVSYYLDLEQTRHLAARDAWRDHRNDLWFIKHDLVCNTMPPDRIKPHLESVFSNPYRRELMEVMIHEQYFCPFLTNFQPDVRERVTEALEWLAERGYRSIFFEEGFLGAPAFGEA